MQFLLVSPPKFVVRTAAASVAAGGHRGGFASRLLHYADQPWAAALASFLTTAIILLPTEYEYPIRSAMLFLSSRRP
jgi:hypothetical protein